MIHIPPLPEMLFGAGVGENMGERIRRLNVKKLFLITDWARDYPCAGSPLSYPPGRAALYGLLCFVRANKETCKEPFIDMAQLLNRSDDLEESLLALYRKLDVSMSFKTLGIPRDDLKKIAFYASRDAVNMATDPTTPGEGEILQLLEEMYE
jgi:alcohol dehydrogenase class IV